MKLIKPNIYKVYICKVYMSSMRPINHYAVTRMFMSIGSVCVGILYRINLHIFFLNVEDLIWVRVKNHCKCYHSI